jgi:DNA-directed RNA polymerase specialized sigma24 family protein
MDVDDLRVKIAKFLTGLSEQARLVMVLCYYEQLSFLEIGKVLNLQPDQLQQIYSTTMSGLKLTYTSYSATKSDKHSTVSTVNAT